MESEKRLHRRRAAQSAHARPEGRLTAFSLRLCSLALVGVAAVTVAGMVAGTAGAAGPLAPNELGRIMILEYHRIDRPEARWTRTPEHFRRDLQRLWERGYRLVPLTALLDGKIALPRGTSPVVLTFDDSSPGQFRYLEGNGEPVIDPECAVGILEAFEREHPEFGHAATFYVLPGADPPNRLFNQPAWATRKLAHLASRGYEIGNHTLWHANLSRYSQDTVRKQLGTAQEWIQAHVPGYRPRTLALPMGAYPRAIEWAVTGGHNGATYRHDAILMVSGGAAPSPHARAFDPYRLPRIQAVEAEIARWRHHFERHPEERYVSDGDPDTITVAPGAAAHLRTALAGRVIERPAGGSTGR